jgi:uncharacterized protein
VLFNATTQSVVAENATLATSPFSRLIGLVGRRALSEKTALGITRCNCVHTFGVRFALDVVFCDAEGRVLYTQTLAKNQVSARVDRCVIVWEAAANTLSLVVSVGDILCLR